MHEREIVILKTAWVNSAWIFWCEAWGLLLLWKPEPLDLAIVPARLILALAAPRLQWDHIRVKCHGASHPIELFIGRGWLHPNYCQERGTRVPLHLAIPEARLVSRAKAMPGHLPIIRADLSIIYNFPVIKGLPVHNDDYGQSHRHTQAHTLVLLSAPVGGRTPPQIDAAHQGLVGQPLPGGA